MKPAVNQKVAGNSVKLASGHPMPMLGLGTWQLTGKACEKSVHSALRMGYRHIDTADYYGNHRDVAAGMKGFDREAIFLTTKIWFTDLSVAGIEKACRRFLKELDTDYIDLLLAHWPNDKIPVTETIGALGKLASEGLVRSIGVSNFDERRLSAAIASSKVPISSDQVEFHPRLYQKELLTFCTKKGVAVTAYCPLGRGGMMSDPVIAGIASRLSKTPAQVALRWLVQHGVTAIPKATSEAHIRENMGIFSWKLPKADMDAIDALGAAGRLVNPTFTGRSFFDSVGAKIARIIPGVMMKAGGRSSGGNAFPGSHSGGSGKGFFDKK